MNLAENKFWDEPFEHEVRLEPIIEEFHSNEGSQMKRTGYRVVKNTRLTAAEKEAISRILHERLAGCVEDVKDALGCSLKEAEKIFALCSSALEKLE